MNGKVVPLSQGKLLGGSSAINGQAFVANSKSAVDAWASFGNPGWDWETMAPYYKKFHTLSRPNDAAVKHLRLGYIDDKVRASDGPIQASFPDNVVIHDPLPSAWVDTLGELGYPASGDPFSGTMHGGYINAMSIDPTSRTRSDSATAYLEPAKARKNLHVETGVTVEKIVFDTTSDSPQAKGLEVKKDGKTSVVSASKEIILAAGVFGTPKLLELSGVGDRERLEKLGIKVVVDNPNVGENLQDHPNAGISFEVADGIQTMDAMSRQEPEAIGAAMQQYATEKTGPFALAGNYAGALVPVKDFTSGPDAESTYKKVMDATATDATPGPFSALHAEYVRSLLSKPEEGSGNLFTYAACGNFVPEGAGADIIHKTGNKGSFFTICAALLFPLSRGSSHINSSNPVDKPTIDPRYMEHPLDIEVLARHLRYINTIAHTAPLNKYLKPDGRRSNGAPKDMNNLDEVKDYVRQAVLSCWHPTSTCAMLPRDKGGVVDSKLGVYGVRGLSIVDSSVLPLATRGNPQTTVYAIAERAADLIKQRHGIKA